MSGKLDLILSEIKQLRDQGDVRFELMKGEFLLVRAEMQGLGTELRSEMQGLGTELRSEMRDLGSKLRTEMQEGFAEVRSDLRSEMHAGFDAVRSGLRAEMRTGFQAVATEFVAVRKDLAFIHQHTINLTERVAVLENRPASSA